MDLLSVNQLVKNYGSFVAVDHISFRIPKGKIIGLLGPNGAGKTTTIQILTGITTSTSGEITYFGKDFFKNRERSLQRINFTSAFNSLQGRISVMENLVVFANLYKIPKPQEKIKKYARYFEIEELMDMLFWNLSAGQKTRVNLVKSLINDPDLILMDEPTASLDPDIADKTLSLIENLRRDRELSILYTSHEMDEVTRVCDEVIFLDKGKIVAKDTPQNLTKRITNASLKIIFSKGLKELQTIIKKRMIKHEFLDNKTVVLYSEEHQIPNLIQEISRANVSFVDIEINKATLEDVFIQIARKKS